MGECKGLTKILAWHMYTPCSNRSEIQDFCGSRTSTWETVYDKVVSDHGFNLEGMYITEFAGWYEACKTDADPEGQQGQALVAEVCTPVLLQHPKVARIAWFNDFESEGNGTQGTSNMWTSSDDLSVIGQAYFNAIASTTAPNSAETTTAAGTLSSTTETTTAAGTSSSGEANTSTSTASSTTDTPSEATSSSTDNDSASNETVMI